MTIARTQILEQSVSGYQTDSPSSQTPNNTWVKLSGATAELMRLGSRVSIDSTGRLQTSRACRHLVEATGTIVVGTADSEVRVAISKTGSDPSSVAQQLGLHRTAQGTYNYHAMLVDDSDGSDYYEVWGFATGATTTLQSWSKKLSCSEVGDSSPYETYLPGNALTYLLADDGPVGTPTTAVGNPVTDWLSLPDAVAGSGPYDWTQSGSGDRGTLNNTAFSGGRLSVVFDGSSDHLYNILGLADELAGSDVPYTRYLHIVVIAVATSNTIYAALGDNSSSTFDFVRDPLAADSALRFMRRDGTISPPTLDTPDTYTTEELSIVESFDGTTKTVWVNGVKEIDGGGFDTAACAFDRASIGGWLGDILRNPSNIAVRRHGLWNVAFDDSQAAALYALHGT